MSSISHFQQRAPIGAFQNDPLILKNKHIYDTQCWILGNSHVINMEFNIYNCPSSPLPVSKQVCFGTCAFHCIRFLEIDPLFAI